MIYFYFTSVIKASHLINLSFLHTIEILSLHIIDYIVRFEYFQHVFNTTRLYYFVQIHQSTMVSSPFRRSNQSSYIFSMERKYWFYQQQKFHTTYHFIFISTKNGRQLEYHKFIEKIEQISINSIPNEVDATEYMCMKTV